MGNNELPPAEAGGKESITLVPGL